MHNIDMNIEEWVDPDAQTGSRNQLVEEQTSELASLPSPNGVSLAKTGRESNGSEYLAFPNAMLDNLNKRRYSGT
jgi:hypothetical protein